MTQAEINEKRLGDIGDMIWSKYVQVYTDIIYASMLSDKLRNRQSDWYFWGIYVCLGLPSVLSILVKNEIITNAWFIYLACGVILLAPIILKWKNKNLVCTALGIYEKRIAGLSANNVKLEQYKTDLLLLYFESDNAKATPQNIELMEEKCKNLDSRYQEYITSFQNYAGEIDLELEARVQEKTDEMIRSTAFYGEEATDKRRAGYPTEGATTTKTT